MVRLDGQGVTLVLSEEGRKVLESVAIEIPDSKTVWFEVKERDERGVWVKLEREDGMHFVLVRWEYILGIDLAEGEVRAEGYLN